MRVTRGLMFLTGLCLAGQAQATTVVILTDPMTMERRTMILESKGPDRVLMCALPPAISGCRDVTPRRRDR